MLIHIDLLTKQPLTIIKTMVKFKTTTLLTSVALLLSVAACGPSLVIHNVDYSQPIESVVAPGEDNIVHDQRYAISFSIAPLLTEEGISSVEEVRIIRNNMGYYFVTAAGFSNVYVMEPAEGELGLKTKILIGQSGLEQPVFNQRGDHIELIDRSTGQTYQVNEEGIREEETQ